MNLIPDNRFRVNTIKCKVCSVVVDFGGHKEMYLLDRFNELAIPEDDFIAPEDMEHHHPNDLVAGILGGVLIVAVAALGLLILWGSRGAF